jgi:hypothetical protein
VGVTVGCIVGEGFAEGRTDGLAVGTADGLALGGLVGRKLTVGSEVGGSVRG